MLGSSREDTLSEIPQHDPTNVARHTFKRSARPSEAAIRTTGVGMSKCPICQGADTGIISEAEAELLCKPHKAKYDERKK